MNFSDENIIFGVTGHRDLCSGDIDFLKKRIKNIFKSFKEKYPHKKFILLSPLAEGADTLTAEVARELGIKLWVMLPFKEECYIKSFEKKNSLQTYEKLKNYAFRFDVLNCSFMREGKKCYRLLGERITDISDILIALWDGVESGKEGGTSQIVSYAKAAKKTLYTINTPRVSNTSIKFPYLVTVI